MSSQTPGDGSGVALSVNSGDVLTAAPASEELGVEAGAQHHPCLPRGDGQCSVQTAKLTLPPCGVYCRSVVH